MSGSSFVLWRIARNLCTNYGAVIGALTGLGFYYLSIYWIGKFEALIGFSTDNGIPTRAFGVILGVVLIFVRLRSTKLGITYGSHSEFPGFRLLLLSLVYAASSIFVFAYFIAAVLHFGADIAVHLNLSRQ